MLESFFYSPSLLRKRFFIEVIEKKFNIKKNFLHPQLFQMNLGDGRRFNKQMFHYGIQVMEAEHFYFIVSEELNFNERLGVF